MGLPIALRVTQDIIPRPMHPHVPPVLAENTPQPTPPRVLGASQANSRHLELGLVACVGVGTSPKAMQPSAGYVQWGHGQLQRPLCALNVLLGFSLSSWALEDSRPVKHVQMEQIPTNQQLDRTWHANGVQLGSIVGVLQQFVVLAPPIPTARLCRAHVWGVQHTLTPLQAPH